MSRNPEDIDAESLLLSKPGQGTCINAGGLHEVTWQRNEVDELHVAVPVAREHATPPLVQRVRARARSGVVAVEAVIGPKNP